MTDNRKGAADRVLELLETKGPHQLADELVSMQDRLQTALDACARMQEQRDQLTIQMIDATYHIGALANLLSDARRSVEYQMGIQRTAEGAEEFRELLKCINHVLAGKLPAPLVPEGQRLIYIGEIEVSSKWWLNCKSEFFSPDEQADFSDWPDGINKLYRLAVAPKPEGGA
jgi:hypothetical protein